MTKTPPHHHKNTTTPHKHHHKNTTIKTPPQKHHHKEYHKNTTTLPQKRHHKNTTTRTPPQKHHHQNTTTKTQKHHHTTTKTPPNHTTWAGKKAGTKPTDKKKNAPKKKKKIPKTSPHPLKKCHENVRGMFLPNFWYNLKQIHTKGWWNQTVEIICAVSSATIMVSRIFDSLIRDRCFFSMPANWQGFWNIHSTDKRSKKYPSKSLVFWMPPGGLF